MASFTPGVWVVTDTIDSTRFPTFSSTASLIKLFCNLFPKPPTKAAIQKLKPGTFTCLGRE